MVCEDHTNDQYITRPLLQAMLAAVGKPSATVQMVTSPRLSGLADLRRNACELLARYGAVANVVLFMIDADGDDGAEGRPNRRAGFEQMLDDHCEKHREKALVVTAHQEVEVWAVWGSRQAFGGQSWASIRSDPHPKQRFFEPLLKSEDRRRPDGGRTRLMEASLSRGWNALASACPELAELEREMRVRFL